jgi:hypothetical protein
MLQSAWKSCKKAPKKVSVRQLFATPIFILLILFAKVLASQLFKICNQHTVCLSEVFKKFILARINILSKFSSKTSRDGSNTQKHWFILVFIFASINKSG